MININFEQLNEISGIYIINNLKNKKFYIGSSKNLYDRLHQHFHNLKYKKHHSNHLQNSYNKYGEDAFNYSILELCNVENLEEREQYWIDFLKPVYNKRLDSTRNIGLKCTEKTKSKISTTLKDKYKNNEIQTYKQDHAKVQTYLYDISSCMFVESFDCIADSLRFVGINKTASVKSLQDRVIYGKYILLFHQEEDIVEYVRLMKERKHKRKCRGPE
jgi:hypothetical protein